MGRFVVAGLAAALLALGVASPAPAQVEDTAAATPGTPTDSASQLQLRVRNPPPRWAITFRVGTLGFDGLQTQPVLAERIDGRGTVLDSTVLTRSLKADGGIQAAVDALASLDRDWAVRVSAGLGRLTLPTAFTGDDTLYLATLSAVPVEERATIWAVEGALRYRIPSGTGLRPYLELGAGALGWRFEGDTDREDTRQLAFLAAAGAVVPVTGWLDGEIRASTRATRTPVAPEPAGSPGQSTRSLRITARDPEASPYADESHELLSELRLDLGLRIRFGQVAAEEPPETDEPTPPPGS